ncbi:Phospholipase/Carboxylesterase [Gimesia panareensis]|uniref:Phospholipase/Carboxylesterase n=2 Tax=Gimesia panareensis TaxID=2527978 RepID=A0A517PZG2_9PLAN|nr:Phospholipase/Carboxylesterase [Gimesia panareensis]
MPSKFKIIITMLAFTLMTAGTTVADDSGMLLEESFETGTTAPEHWKQGARLPGVRYVYDKGRGKTGKRSLSLQKSAKRYFPIAQWYRLLPCDGKAQTLEISCQVKAEQATKAIIDVQFLDQNQKLKGHQWACYIGAKQAGDGPVTHDWKEYTGEVSVPANTSQLVIGLQIYGPGKVWFDDLQVKLKGEGTAATSKSPQTRKVKVGDKAGEYLLIAPEKKNSSEKTQPLLIVLPGGDGSADFHPFVKRIYENALNDQFILVQPLARKWTDSQQIVWPTSDSKTPGIGYTTEELIAAIIKALEKNYQLDQKQIYLLAWSSGGPAAYATLLQKDSPVSGALIAMSVFKPEQLPDPANARKRSIFLLHSPQDRICPYWMAEQAQDQLTKAGLRITLVNYPGGHGWKGNVYGNIREGIHWLQQAP